MPGFFEKIQAKLELYRLEQRYTRNRHRRSTFISNAMYVDGEYVYQTPTSTGSSANSSAATSPVDEGRRSFDAPAAPSYQPTPEASPKKKRSNRRLSAMPGFGSLAHKKSQPDWRQNGVFAEETR